MLYDWVISDPDGESVIDVPSWSTIPARSLILVIGGPTVSRTGNPGARRTDADRYPDLALLITAMTQEWRLLSGEANAVTEGGPPRSRANQATASTADMEREKR
jgi:hypothetical protein